MSNISSITQVQFQSGRHRSHKPSASRATRMVLSVQPLRAAPQAPPSPGPPFISQTSENSCFSIFIVIKAIRVGKKIPGNGAGSIWVLLLLPIRGGSIFPLGGPCAQDLKSSSPPWHSVMRKLLWGAAPWPAPTACSPCRATRSHGAELHQATH